MTKKSIIKKPSGKFITIEGIEGVGKTTARQFIEHYLIAREIKFLLTREPGGTPIAEEIRHILLHGSTKQETMMPETELLLMFACRAQHLANIVLPALRESYWVVSDRYVDASYAYQGGGRQLDLRVIEFLDQWLISDVQPDCTILLDAPPEIGLARAKRRGTEDRIEREKLDFFERVRAVYLTRAHHHPERFFIIDATAPLAEVEVEITKVLDQL